MNFRYTIRFLVVLTVFITAFSCNKREIIPAPEPMVELENHFYANINNTDVELTQNVNGYTGDSGVDLIINATTLDSAVYHSTFSSSQSQQAASVGHGSIIFDWNANERPNLSTFENFYLGTTNQVPLFSPGGLNGFTFTYTDGAGHDWVSKDLGTATYTKMSVESDKTGDYAKFRVEFDTRIYYTYVDPVTQLSETDSMEVTNAVYTGWYKR